MTLSHAIVTVVAILGLVGCSAAPQQLKTATKGEILSERILLAEASETRGDLSEALFHWEVAMALAPHDERIAARLEHLRKAREEQARGYRDAGIRALSRGDNQRARRNLFRALALDPCDRQALEQLRKVERDQLARRLATKVERSRQALVASGIETADTLGQDEQPEYMDSENRATSARQNTENQESRKNLVKRQLDRAEERFAEGDYDAALQTIERAEATAANERSLVELVGEHRKKYADRLYAKGVGLFTTAPHRALDYWREARRYDPQHKKAAARIKWFSPQ